MPVSEFRPEKSAAGGQSTGAPSGRVGQGKNLILACVGDSSCHQEWIRGNPGFDLILIYYGNHDAIFSEYAKDALMCIRQQGQKFPLLKTFLGRHRQWISQYAYVWLPDDDVFLSTDDVNNLFSVAKTHELLICQPSVEAADGVVSHEITSPRKGLQLRFTNFVEVMMPLFETQTLLRLCDDFDLSQSGWGLDMSWSRRLDDPQDKMAVIDMIVAHHTKPIGRDYSRFEISPPVELTRILEKYKIHFIPDNYSGIGRNRGPVDKFFLLKYRLEEKLKKINPLCRPRPFV